MLRYEPDINKVLRMKNVLQYSDPSVFTEYTQHISN